MLEAAKFYRIAKALADPRRFAIYEKIAQADDEMCCGAITHYFTVSQATISHHLKELTDAGLIEPRARGQFKPFRARPEVLAAYIDELQRRTRLSQAQSKKTTIERPEQSGG